jgi:hypothetical protein
MVPAIGNDPTSQDFQSRANPSQLHWHLSIVQHFFLHINSFEFHDVVVIFPHTWMNTASVFAVSSNLRKFCFATHVHLL